MLLRPVFDHHHEHGAVEERLLAFRRVNIGAHQIASYGQIALPILQNQHSIPGGAFHFTIQQCEQGLEFRLGMQGGIRMAITAIHPLSEIASLARRQFRHQDGL